MIKPLKDRIVVKLFEEEEKTKGGLFLPDTMKEKQNKGTVIVIGKDVVEIKVDDNVIFGKHTGVEITYEGYDYLLMRESDVFAIL